MERLDKILSSQGICSRKEAKGLVMKQKIKINGALVRRSDIKINPDCDIIEVDGVAVEYRPFVYIMMNKPKGVLSASNDRNAKTVIDLLPDNYKRKGLFPAGRLDKDTTGLLIITDDGDFAHRMLSPKKHVYKLYNASLDGELTDIMVQTLENGIELADGTEFKPARISFPDSNDRTSVNIEICEGKYHQVKRMFEFVGLFVTELKRIRIGSLYLDRNLSDGECRFLKELELKDIFNRHNN